MYAHSPSFMPLDKIREDPEAVVQRGSRLSGFCDMRQPMERRQGQRRSYPLWSRTAGRKGHGGHTSRSPAAAREVWLSGCGREERARRHGLPWQSGGRPVGWVTGGGRPLVQRGCAPCLIPLVALAGQRAQLCCLRPHARVLRWTIRSNPTWIGGR